MTIRIYHNPRCSKSRATLALLRAHGVEPQIIEYLNDPPDRHTLQALIGKLGIAARDLIRTGEPEFREAGVSPQATDDVLIELMVSIPKLIERPIVEAGNRACIGRPPENVLELLP